MGVHQARMWHHVRMSTEENTGVYLLIAWVLRRSIVRHSIEVRSAGADFGLFPTLDPFGTIGSKLEIILACH